MSKDIINNTNFKFPGEPERFHDIYIHEDRGYGSPTGGISESFIRRERKLAVIPDEKITRSKQPASRLEDDPQYQAYLDEIATIRARRILERESNRPITEEDLKKRDDNERIDRKKDGPLGLVGLALKSRTTRVVSWNPLIMEYLYTELTDKEIGEREKGRVLKLLEDSGLGRALGEEEAIVLQRSIEEGKGLNFATDIALQPEGIFRYLRIGFPGQEGFQTLTSKPIPVEDYPLYSDLVDQTAIRFVQTQERA